MRLASPTQLPWVMAKDRTERWRVEIADHEGTLIDRSSWVRSGRIAQDQDSYAISCDLELMRERNGQSIVPLIADPMPLSGGRRVVVHLALCGLDEEPESGHWIKMFDGRSDDPSWGGEESTLELPCRSRIAALLHDRWVELPTVYSGRQDLVIQELLDDTLGEDAPDLIVIGDPDTEAMIPPYEQRRQSLQDAIEALANVNGWICRERWHDPSNDFRLVLYQPERVQQSQDHGFNSGDYYMVDDARLQYMGVRSIVQIEWSTDSADPIAEAIDEDAVARPGVGRRVLFIDASQVPFITSEAQAQALAEMILMDVSTELETQVVRHALYWRAQLGDYYGYLPNNVHAGLHHQLAVTGIEHEWSNDPELPNVTLLSTRGRPSGGMTRWHILDQRTREREDLGVPSPDPGPTPPIPGTGSAAWFLTDLEAEEGFSGPSEPARSLGRYVSTTPVSPGVWRAITPEDVDGGTTLYRVIALVNQSDGWIEALRAWTPDDLSEYDIEVEIAVDPSGPADYDDEDPQGMETADEETAPTPLSGSLTWGAPPDVLTGQVMGLLPPWSVIFCGVRLIVADEASAFPPEDPEICAQSCFPHVGVPL